MKKLSAIIACYRDAPAIPEMYRPPDRDVSLDRRRLRDHLRQRRQSGQRSRSPRGTRGLRHQGRRGQPHAELRFAERLHEWPTHRHRRRGDPARRRPSGPSRAHRAVPREVAGRLGCRLRGSRATRDDPRNANRLQALLPSVPRDRLRLRSSRRRRFLAAGSARHRRAERSPGIESVSPWSPRVGRLQADGDSVRTAGASVRKIHELPRPELLLGATRRPVLLLRAPRLHRLARIRNRGRLGSRGSRPDRVAIRRAVACPKGITSILVVMFFLGGIQLLCLAIIGSYLAHIYEEVKRRPAYIVESVLNAPGTNSQHDDEVDASVDVATHPIGPRRMRHDSPRAASWEAGREARCRHGRSRLHRRKRRSAASRRRVRGDSAHRAGFGLLAAHGDRGPCADRATRPGRRGCSRNGGRPRTPDWILHLAAHGAYSWQTDRAAILRTNVVGTANLLEAARTADVDVFVNTGSSSEYGLKDRAPRRAKASSRTARTRSPRPRRRCSAVTLPKRTVSTSAHCACTRPTDPGKSQGA